VQRTQTWTLAFALAAALVTVLSSVFAYETLRAALEREFQARMAKVAGMAASQVSAVDADEVRRFGIDSGAYEALQVQLVPMSALTGLENLALLDSTGRTIYDVSAEPVLGERSAYDSLAHAAFAQALTGRRSAASLSTAAGETRVAFAPVRDGRRVVAVIAAEARPSWEPELQELRRRIGWIALVSMAAIGVLAGILMRLTGRHLALERRLSRSENLAAMGRLTATLAHEIKNPLAIIRGSARRLGKLEPESQRMADSVVEEVDRLTHTVARYLQFARGETPERETGDAAAALAATLDLLEGEFRARHCTLVRTGDAATAEVRLDPESLKQVCLNLVLNALEVLPEGGSIRAGLVTAAGRARIEVSDDGPGVPAELLHRLGEPFFTTKAQGTGLGLFLSRRLVEGAGGTLRIDSRTGGGTTVTVDLPLARVESGPRKDDN